MSGIPRLLFFTGAFAFIGYFLGEYHPLWGLASVLGEPFSPLRNNAATTHAILIGAVGLVIALWLNKRDSDEDFELKVRALAAKKQAAQAAQGAAAESNNDQPPQA